ncbi:hypothetical protein pb186bvf_008731 [Paramecium bursaria]
MKQIDSFLTQFVNLIRQLKEEQKNLLNEISMKNISFLQII